MQGGDAEIKLRSRVWTLRLLAYIVLHRSQPIPRPRLAFTIWPDEPEESALQNLRRNLHLPIKALPPTSGGAWILADDESVAWNSEPHRLPYVASRVRAERAVTRKLLAHYDGRAVVRDVEAEFPEHLAHFAACTSARTHSHHQTGASRSPSSL